MHESNTASYQWQTSVQDVVAAVECVARSKSPLFEFGLEGNAAAAAREASELGWLDFVANGVVQLTDAGRGVALQKDPVGMAMNIVALRQMMVNRKSNMKASFKSNGSEVVRVRMKWLEMAMYETSATPKGGFKQAWTMKLMRSGSRCQLPRGFIKGRTFFVGGK